ncbi:MAG: hypothetical protein ACI4UY_07825 [Kiritimatiellia bacterium]
MCNRRVSLLLACLSVSAFAVTERTLLDDGWRFHTGWEQGSRRFTSSSTDTSPSSFAPSLE